MAAVKMDEADDLGVRPVRLYSSEHAAAWTGRRDALTASLIGCVASTPGVPLRAPMRQPMAPQNVLQALPFSTHPGMPAKIQPAAATVFVVDDDIGVRKSVRALLESASFVVETFASAAEFLAIYDPKRVGCLVLDVRLRQSSGLDLQDDLRRRKSTLPIIILTGFADAQMRARAKHAGAFDFLQKPTPPAVLLERITAAIEFDARARATTGVSNAFHARLTQLTVEERTCMELLIAGQSPKLIAARMQMSVAAVGELRRRLLAKLQMASVAQMTRMVSMAGASRARH